VSGDEARPEDINALVAGRLARYVELWGAASSKLATGRYHADDLVEDWFRWVGLVAQDTTAAATLIVRAAQGAAGERAREAPDAGAPPG
jgi:hypothetical protein